MEEHGEGPKQMTIEFTWEHPKNNCIMQRQQPIIRQALTAIGSNYAEATLFARILAENTPQICEACRENYLL